MKNPYKNLSLFIAGVLFAISVSAQSETPIAQKTDIWQVQYWVTVEGDFKKEPELGEDGPTIYYHIKRRYEGKAKLVFLPIPGNPSSAIRTPQFRSSSRHIHITIKDLWNTIYDPVCGDYESIEQFWDADVYGFEQNPPALLLINNTARTFKTSFPILYSGSRQDHELIYRRIDVMNKAGGIRKIVSDKTERQHFIVHEYPNIKGYIEKASIMRSANWSELKKDASTPDSYYWLSEVLHPDEPLIPGVPESKDKVNIRVFYEFRKISG